MRKCEWENESSGKDHYSPSGSSVCLRCLGQERTASSQPVTRRGHRFLLCKTWHISNESGSTGLPWTFSEHAENIDLGGAVQHAVHICTHAHGCHQLWTNMTCLEQDNNNGINGIPGFSRFLIYLRWWHRTKVTVSIMQSHNATDLSNNTDV